MDFDLSAIDRVTIVACGTSYLCRHGRQILVRAFARCRSTSMSHPNSATARCRCCSPALRCSSRQSGETADTLAALRHCRKAKGQTIARSSTCRSTMAREPTCCSRRMPGRRSASRRPRRFTCQLAVLAALAARTSPRRRAEDQERSARLCAPDPRRPLRIERQALKLDEADRGDGASAVSGARDVLYLGRDTDYPLAMEGALKLKEISYIHAEGYACGRDEAWPDRADRRECAGDRHRAQRAALRKDRQQHAGSAWRAAARSC
jgi:glucosamine--fructose-6-phosphate aminotransferase (isomerizing)